MTNIFGLSSSVHSPVAAAGSGSREACPAQSCVALLANVHCG